jgi:hypothetical protein
MAAAFFALVAAYADDVVIHDHLYSGGSALDPGDEGPKCTHDKRCLLSYSSGTGCLKLVGATASTTAAGFTPVPTEATMNLMRGMNRTLAGETCGDDARRWWSEGSDTSVQIYCKGEWDYLSLMLKASWNGPRLVTPDACGCDPTPVRAAHVASKNATAMVSAPARTMLWPGEKGAKACTGDPACNWRMLNQGDSYLLLSKSGKGPPLDVKSGHVMLGDGFTSPTKFQLKP